MEIHASLGNIFLPPVIIQRCFMALAHFTARGEKGHRLISSRYEHSGRLQHIVDELAMPDTAFMHGMPEGMDKLRGRVVIVRSCAFSAGCR